MALRDQPYLPLYVQDYLTDEKLNMCSAASQGVYIKIMCLFHKTEPYGGILLKQKDKQNESKELNFATKLARLLPFSLPEINKAIGELLEEEVLKIDGDFLYQKRMIRDYDLSIKRALAGKKGGEKSQLLIKNFGKAKGQANTENENENENEIVNIPKGSTEGKNEVDYESIVNLFHSICTELPRIQKLTEAREKAIKQRISEHSKEKVAEMIEIVGNSKFLNGENDKGWKADFDWLFKPSNFIKVIEGNYSNKSCKNGKKTINSGESRQPATADQHAKDTGW